MGSVLPEPQLRNLGEVSSLGTLLQVLVEESYGRIRTLVDQIQSVQEEEKQHRLLRYLFQYKQRLLRLVTLVRWMRKNPENMNSVSHCRKLLDVTARHQGIFQETADKLFFLWRDELQVFRAPIYDIPTAYEVLTTGTFASMPACLEELKGVDLPSAEEQRKASRRMDMLLRCCLLDAQLPEGVRVARTQGGVTTLRCEGMYEVGLTLVPLPREAEAERGAIPAEKVKSEGILGGGSPGTGPVKREEPSEPDGLGAQAVEQEPEEEQQQWRWCLVELVILPGSRRASQLTAQQDLQLREAIQARMWEESLAHRCPTEAPGAGPKQLYSAPLALMHRLLSDIASRLLIDNLVSTARQIANPSGGWENLLKLEPLSAGRSGISVTYWLGFPGIVQSASDSKAAEDSEKPQPPSIEVELRDGAVTATHNPPLTDPTTGLPVAVDVEPLSADAEKLLLGAASSYAYMQLHALAEELKSDRHKEKLEPIKGDVLLRRDIRRGHRGCLAQHEAKEDLVLPCIELVAGDDVMLIVQMRLRSGKLMLRPGQGLGGDIASDVSCFLKHEERRLHDIQESPGDAVQQRGRSTGADEPPASATALVVERLLSFLMKLSQRDSLAQIMVSCRPLLVQYMPSMPRHLFEACIACGSRSPSSYLAFPPIPLPPGFPLNRVFSTGSTNLQGASRLIEQYGRGDVHRGFGQGAALRFHLGLDVSMASSMRRLGEAPQPMPRFSLFVSSVSFRNVSLQPIRRIIVPPVTLEAARHRSASRLGKRKRVAEGSSFEWASSSPSWGLEFAEELAGAVDWCQHQIVWELIKAQLDALQIKYTEEVALRRLPTNNPELQQSLSRRLNLVGPQDAAIPQNGIRASIQVGEELRAIRRGEWTVVLVSTYLAGLPGTAVGPGGRLIPPGVGEPEAEPLSLDDAPCGEDGAYAITYSVFQGHSVVDTLQDVECVMVTALVTQRVRAYLAAEPTSQETGGAPEGSDCAGATAEGDSAAHGAEVNGSGSVRLTGAGVSSFELTWAPPAWGSRVHGGAADDAMVPLGELRLRVRWLKSSPVTGKWTGPPGSSEFSVSRPRAAVETDPPVLGGIWQHFEEMFSDGDESLAVDALRLVSAPALALSEALRDENLRAAGFYSGSIIAKSGSSPYALRLLLKHGESCHRVELRVYALGIVRLRFPVAKEGSFKCFNLEQLFEKISQAHQTLTDSGKIDAPFVFENSSNTAIAWAHVTFLGAVVREIVKHVASAHAAPCEG